MVYLYIGARERLLEMHKDKKPTFPAAGEKLPLLKKLSNGLHFARKDRNIKNWCTLVCTGVLLNAFFEQMHPPPPSGFLVHNLVLAHPRHYKYFVKEQKKSLDRIQQRFTLLRLVRKAPPQLPRPRSSADTAINIFDFFHHLMCCLSSSLERRWNARTSFNSPRQCEVWHFITGARETVTVTLVIHSYYSSCQVKVRQCTCYKTKEKRLKRPCLKCRGWQKTSRGCRSVLSRFIFRMQAMLAAILISASCGL